MAQKPWLGRPPKSRLPLPRRRSLTRRSSPWPWPPVTPPRSGPCLGGFGSSATAAGWPTISAMSGTCWTGWSSAASGRPAGLSNATRRRSPTGDDNAGPPRRPDRRLHRRKRPEPPAPPGADLGAQRPDAGAPGNLRLAESVAHRRAHLERLPLPATRREHQVRAGRGVPGRAPAASAGTGGRLVLERLPAYAPELNPVECLWGHLKEHELSNLLVRHAHGLGHHATAALRRFRRRPRISTACWKQASLNL